MRRGMMIAVAAAAAGFFGGGPARAEQRTETPAQVAATEALDALLAATRSTDTIAILHDEGVAYATLLEARLSTGGEAWQRAIARAYDPDRMRIIFEANLTSRMLPRDIGQVGAWFAAPAGSRIVAAELGARRVMTSAEGRAEAAALWQGLDGSGTPREAALRRLAEAGDLLETAVTGALNHNMAFYMGIAAPDGDADETTAAQAQAQVEPRADAIRVETEAWVRAWAALAFRDLSDADLEAYTAFLASPLGERWSRALDDATEAVYADTSRRLGQEASPYLAGKDI